MDATPITKKQVLHLENSTKVEFETIVHPWRQTFSLRSGSTASLSQDAGSGAYFELSIDASSLTVFGVHGQAGRLAIDGVVAELDSLIYPDTRIRVPSEVRGSGGTAETGPTILLLSGDRGDARVTSDQEEQLLGSAPFLWVSAAGSDLTVEVVDDGVKLIGDSVRIFAP